MNSKNTQTQEFSPRAIEIYDEVMESLGAPELKMASVHTLHDDIAGESVLDRAARYERYEAIFKEADRILEMKQLGMELNMHQMLAAKKAEVLKKETEEKTEKLQDIEDQLDSQLED